MALSRIDQKHVDGLLSPLSNNLSVNTLEAVKQNHIQYARLKQLAKQMELIKREIQCYL